MNKQVKQSIILSLALLLAIVQGAQAQESISVYANNDNHTNWTEYNGQTVSSFTIHNRTLYKDGKWNTLCLPFDLTIAGSVLNGADVRTLSSSSFNSNTGELTLNFTPSPDETVWFKPATDGGKVAEVTASSDTRFSTSTASPSCSTALGRSTTRTPSGISATSYIMYTWKPTSKKDSRAVTFLAIGSA